MSYVGLILIEKVVLLWFHLYSRAFNFVVLLLQTVSWCLISLFLNFSYKNASEITGSLAFNFRGQPNHENHENFCSTNINETKVLNFMILLFYTLTL